MTLILISFQESDVENTLDKDIQSQTNKTEFKPLPKEWQKSGPFEIDRREYAIGEKIFLVVKGLQGDDKGQIDIMRPGNATQQLMWDAIPFSNDMKLEFRFYFEPKISKIDGICSVDDMIGKWSLVFRGTNYPALDFNITELVVPGTNIEQVC